MAHFGPELTEAALKELLKTSEGPLIDFKQAHIASQAPREHLEQKRGEWIKDILAFANTRRTRTAYILVGIAGDRSIIGIKETQDDASFQRMVERKCNRVPLFRYYEMTLSCGSRVGVFEIPEDQPRPIYLKSSYGPVDPLIVYVRHGSTNAPLEPDRWRELFPIGTSGSSSMPATATQDVQALTKRWLEVFETHGVKHHQIPALLADHYLPLHAFNDWRELAGLLNKNVLIDTANLFNIRHEWLVGDSDMVYDNVGLIYDVKGLLDVLEEWVPVCEDLSILAFQSGRKPLEKDRGQICAFMLRGTIHEFGEKRIFKYQPLYGEFEWSYDKGRCIAKIAWLAARLAGCESRGWRFSKEEISELCEGNRLMDVILNKHSTRIEWHPEDFAYSPGESMVAKEAHEYPLIEKMAKEYGVIDRALAIRTLGRRVNVTRPAT